MQVGIRFNYTSYSLESFVDVLQDFEDLPEEKRKQIHFDFQQVWQDKRIDEDIVKKVKEHFWQRNFGVSLEQAVARHRCYADQESDIVINYTGDLYKCTAREFNRGLREGALSKNGDLIWNNLYERRMAVKYSNSICQACKIFPLCFGTCSQQQLEKGKNGCIRDLSEVEKEKAIENRIIWKLKQKE